MGPSICGESQSLGMIAQCMPHLSTKSDGLGGGETESSGSTCPPGFEGVLGGDGLSNIGHGQSMSIGIFESEDLREKGNEVDQRVGESLCSSSNLVDLVPQTSVMDSVQVMHIEGIEDEVLCEKDLIEAQVSWDIG